MSDSRTWPEGLVNGKEVQGDYKLKSGDSLEFMKPSGRKGC